MHRFPALAERRSVGFADTPVAAMHPVAVRPGIFNPQLHPVAAAELYKYSTPVCRCMLIGKVYRILPFFTGYRHLQGGLSLTTKQPTQRQTYPQMARMGADGTRKARSIWDKAENGN